VRDACERPAALRQRKNKSDCRSSFPRPLQFLKCELEHLTHGCAHITFTTTRQHQLLLFLHISFLCVYSMICIALFAIFLAVLCFSVTGFTILPTTTTTTTYNRMGNKESLGSCSTTTTTTTTVVSSYLNEISMGPPDAILGIAQAFRSCSDSRKVNVCVGAYRDASGKPWVLPSVREAEMRLLEENKEYLPIEGDAVFIAKALQFAYGENVPLERIAGVQSLSGTGACRGTVSLLLLLLLLLSPRHVCVCVCAFGCFTTTQTHILYSLFYCIHTSFV
jgi:Aminotransferase class I and II